MTGAVKNLYGCIPGKLKTALHVVYPTPQEFCRMLVALNLLLRPRLRLHIMDGVMAMEGNGPRGGNTRHLGVLLFSADPVALDAVMCRLVELNPLYMSTARPGRAWGLGTYLPEDIELAGDSVERLRNGDFRVSRGPVLGLSQAGMMSYISNVIGKRPVIDPRKCTRCGQCVQACPVRPKAVDWHDGNRKRSPSYKYLRCIRCYCCQESCPEGAIAVKSTLLAL
jgi:Pyruvate/2-oxoacid:ferredoxin oxidoreductase delta subunit